MISSTVSILLPKENNIPFYESFVNQYSFIISVTFITHYIIGNKCNDEEILQIFQNMHGKLEDYNTLQIYMQGAGLCISAPQLDEHRGLLNEKVFNDLMKKKISSKDILLFFNNALEFTSIYALFELTIKRILQENNIISNKTFFREEEFVEKINEYLDSKSIKDKFYKELNNRISISNGNVLKMFFNYFTCIRHLYAHNGGMISPKWKQDFLSKKGILENNLPFSINNELVVDSLTKIKVNSNDYFYLPDIQANIFRNICVSIIEAIYVTYCTE